MLLQWVFVHRGVSGRPVKGRHVHFVKWLVARGRERAQHTAMESPIEAEHSQIWRARCLVFHAGLQFQLVEVNSVAPFSFLVREK